MKVFSEKNVYDASIERLNYLFDEFEDVYVSVSGGKDSTVALFMTLEVARQRGRKVGVFFLDQEFEYQSTIDLIREWMHMPDVVPYWLQAPLRMYNANSPTMPYIEIWDESRRDTWMREKEPDSIQVPFSAERRFHKTMEAFTDWRQDVTGLKTCCITGMRAEESFNRFRATTSGITYKNITWGRRNKNTVTFHPFYDWTFRDVWKYICDNKLKYNSVYDKFYQLGVPIPDMRVSNLIHEYTIATVIYLAEVEPETYEKLTRALPGVSTSAKFAEDFIPKKLPEAFVSWKEYRDYLVETIVAPEYREGFKKVWEGQADDERVYRMNCIECIKSDVTHTIHSDRTSKVSYKIKRHEKEKLQKLQKAKVKK